MSKQRRRNPTKQGGTSSSAIEQIREEGVPDNLRERVKAAKTHITTATRKLHSETLKH